jgi:hypothetical protein
LKTEITTLQGIIELGFVYDEIEDSVSFENSYGYITIKQDDYDHFFYITSGCYNIGKPLKTMTDVVTICNLLFETNFTLLK